MFLAEGIERRFHIKAVMPSQRAKQVEVIDVSAIPAADGALGEARLGIQDNAALVEKLGDAEAVTTVARPRRVVKGEQPRLQFIDGSGRSWGKRNVPRKASRGRRPPSAQWPPPRR